VQSVCAKNQDYLAEAHGPLGPSLLHLDLPVKFCINVILKTGATFYYRTFGNWVRVKYELERDEVEDVISLYFRYS